MVVDDRVEAGFKAEKTVVQQMAIEKVNVMLEWTRRLRVSRQPDAKVLAHKIGKQGQ